MRSECKILVFMWSFWALPMSIGVLRCLCAHKSPEISHPYYMAVSVKLGAFLVAVLAMRAALFRFYIGAPDSWNLPNKPQYTMILLLKTQNHCSIWLILGPPVFRISHIWAVRALLWVLPGLPGPPLWGIDSLAARLEPSGPFPDQNFSHVPYPTIGHHNHRFCRFLL